MMQTFKTYVTIDNPDQVILSNLPFQKGQRVEIVVSLRNPDLKAIDRLRSLTKNAPKVESENPSLKQLLLADPGRTEDLIHSPRGRVCRRTIPNLE